MENGIDIQRSMKRKLLFVFLIISVILVFLLNISLGAVKIPISEVIEILIGNVTESTNYSIIMKIRLPRALATLAGGACLSISGLLLQIFFNNPIVEPYVLGISSGSMLFVGIVMLGGYSFGFRMTSPMFMFLGALAGAFIVMVAVVFAAAKVKSIITLLVIGIMAGYLCSAITSILIAFASLEAIGGYTLKTMGTFAGFTWQEVRILFSTTFIFSVAAILMSKPLNAMLLGERYAESMGVGIKLFRILIVIISSILTAVLTAFAGPISFVGLAVPHLIRLSFKTSDNRILLPASILAGGLMTGICDLGARMLFAPHEIPIGALTSLIGAPLLVYMLIRGKNEL